MAINPETQYPGKIAPSTPDYPYGGARNITVPGDGTGTPWEAALVNDIFGFQQALLGAAGFIPSGTPEKATASQYLDSLLSLTQQRVTSYAALRAVDSSKLKDGALIAVTDIGLYGTFKVATGVVTDDGGVNIVFSDDSNRYAYRVQQDLISVKWFGAKGDGVTDDTAAIQSAIVYAETFVEDTPNVDNRGGKDVIIPDGQYIVSSATRISKYNVGIIGVGKPTFITNFSTTITPANCAVFIIGSAEDWLNSPTISTTTKYNRVINIRISRTGGGSPIGIMSTGTRNLALRDIHCEQIFCGLWMENTSELTCDQFSTIGCNYGMIGDSRKARPAGSSPLGISNADNDCSSNTFNGFTAYYPQHTGILFINTGTSSIYSATIGRFSENPSSGTALRYGLTGKSAGVHYWGANQNFTKAGVLDDIVYEPTPTQSKTCILVTSEETDNPIRGLTFRNQHVQTWAADYDNNIVTTLLVTESYNGGGVDSCVLKESGFTFATSGFEYPVLIGQTPDASVGAAVSNASIKIENCYPTVAVSTSNIGASRLDNIEYLEQTNMELNREAGGEPEGWSLNTGTLTNLGGASGQEAYIRLEGNAGNPVYISKSFRYRYFTSRLGSPYISLWYRGDTAPHIDIVVNGSSATSRLIKSGDNLGRYSNALEDMPQSNKWRRAVYMFRPFSANYPFDSVLLSLGRSANGLTNYTEIKGIEVGFYTIKEEPYNTF